MRSKLLLLVAASFALATAILLVLSDESREPVASPEPALPPPAIRGVKLAAEPAANGIALRVDVALQLHEATEPRTDLEVHARCDVGGQWRDGYVWLRVDRLARGTSVVTANVELREPRDYLVQPSSCSLDFDLRGRDFRRTQKLGHMCWTGNSVVACASPTDRENDSSGGTSAARAS